MIRVVSILLHVGEKDGGCVVPCCSLQLQAQMLRISTCVMVYISYCHAGVVVDEVEVLPSDPPQRPTSVPQALQQNMPLAAVSCPYPLTCQCFACCFAAALCYAILSDQ
jgi:hypothetical protein